MVSRIPNDMFQFSTVSALMGGLASSGPTVSQLEGYGTHGIGTFANMNGELLYLDGKAWQMTGASGIQPADPHTPLPFIQVTKFAPEYRVNVPARLRKSDLLKIFAAGGPEAGGANSFIPFAVTGTFESMSARLAGPQKDGETLAQVAENAKQVEFEDVKGTVFGFVSPAWSQGISVKGVHCHFLSEEGEGGKREGGHVREFVAKEGVMVEWAVTGRFHLGLPRGEEWEALELGVDEAGISKAED